eukprot:1375727-Amorphochlora_amoeboformis.AAC.1
MKREKALELRKVLSTCKHNPSVSYNTYANVSSSTQREPEQDAINTRNLSLPTLAHVSEEYEGKEDLR